MSAERIVTWGQAAQGNFGIGPSVVVMGIFDGLHEGHRALIAMARARAAELGVPCVVATFAKDPDEVFRADDPAFGKLLPNGLRMEMLADLSAGIVLAMPASAEIFSMEPLEFLDELGVICEPRAIYVGDDFRFGRGARGTVDDIDHWGIEHGCRCEATSLLEETGAPVTATRIRMLLRKGDVAEAKLLMAGRAHAVYGTVVHGRGEGTGFGFATANLDLSDNVVMLPREGVYGGYAIVDGAAYATAVNVGVAKSFERATAPIEAHLLDFEGDLYGKDVKVTFEQWLRESRVFDSQDELIETVMGNIEWVREHLGGNVHGTH